MSPSQSHCFRLAQLISTISFMLACFANPLAAQNIQATAGDDLVVIHALDHTIAINGEFQPLPANDTVRILGLAGDDRVLFLGDPNTLERARMVRSSLIVEFGSRKIIAGGFETLEMRGNPNDQLVMEDSSENDQLVIAPPHTTLASANRRCIGEGFARIEVNSVNGGRDTVSVRTIRLDRLVSRPDQVVLSSTHDPSPIARHFVNGFSKIETEFVRHFSLFDSTVDDHLILARRRLRWISSGFEIEHIGDYEKVVATSGRFAQTGDDTVSIRMQKEGETLVDLDDDSVERQLKLRYLSPDKEFSLVNFEEMNVDILPEFREGEAQLILDRGDANRSLTVDAETRSSDLFVSAPYFSRLNASGFDRTRFTGGPATWYGTDGDDEVVARYVGLGFLQFDEYTFNSNGFIYEHIAGENPLATSMGNRLLAFAGDGNDFGIFFDEGTSYSVRSDVILRNGFIGDGFNDTATLNEGDSDDAEMFVETTRSTGTVKVVASPTSVAFSGEGFSHKVFNYPHVGIGFNRFASDLTRFTGDVARDYGQGRDKVNAVYNAKGIGPLTLTRNGLANYSRVSPFDKFAIQSATVAGNLYKTPESEVIFYRNSYTFDTYLFSFENGPSVGGLGSIRLVNPPDNFSEETLPPLQTPTDY